MPHYGAALGLLTIGPVDYLNYWTIGLFKLSDYLTFRQKEGVQSSMMEIVICQAGAHHGSSSSSLLFLNIVYIAYIYDI